MEKWQRERDEERRTRDEEDSMERFKRVMAELLQPLLAKPKKKKNMK